MTGWTVKAGDFTKENSGGKGGDYGIGKNWLFTVASRVFFWIYMDFLGDLWALLLSCNFIRFL